MRNPWCSQCPASGPGGSGCPDRTCRWVSWTDDGTILVDPRGGTYGGTADGFPALVRTAGGRYVRAWLKCRAEGRGSGLSFEQTETVFRYETSVLGALGRSSSVPKVLVKTRIDAGRNRTALPDLTPRGREAGATWGDSYGGNTMAVWYVMTQAPGTTWSRCEFARRNVRLPLYRLCRALWDLHRRGFGHYDLKPDNIHWNEADGILQLVDFGFAKGTESWRRESPDHRNDPAVEAMQPGSRPWVAPEWARCGWRELTPESDGYVYGLLFLQTVLDETDTWVGKTFLRATLPVAPDQRTCSTLYSRLLGAGVSEGISRLVVYRLLAPAPQTRKGALEELLAEMERLGWDSAVNRRSAPWGTIAAAAAVCIAVGVGIALLVPGGTESGGEAEIGVGNETGGVGGTGPAKTSTGALPSPLPAAKPTPEPPVTKPRAAKPTLAPPVTRPSLPPPTPVKLPPASDEKPVVKIPEPWEIEIPESDEEQEVKNREPEKTEFDKAVERWDRMSDRSALLKALSEYWNSHSEEWEQKEVYRYYRERRRPDLRPKWTLSGDTEEAEKGTFSPETESGQWIVLPETMPAPMPEDGSLGEVTYTFRWKQYDETKQSVSRDVRIFQDEVEFDVGKAPQPPPPVKKYESVSFRPGGSSGVVPARLTDRVTIFAPADSGANFEEPHGGWKKNGDTFWLNMDSVVTCTDVKDDVFFQGKKIGSVDDKRYGKIKVLISISKTDLSPGTYVDLPSDGSFSVSTQKQIQDRWNGMVNNGDAERKEVRAQMKALDGVSLDGVSNHEWLSGYYRKHPALCPVIRFQNTNVVSVLVDGTTEITPGVTERFPCSDIEFGRNKEKSFLFSLSSSDGAYYKLVQNSIDVHVSWDSGTLTRDVPTAKPQGNQGGQTGSIPSVTVPKLPSEEDMRKLDEYLRDLLSNQSKSRTAKNDLIEVFMNGTDQYQKLVKQIRDYENTSTRTEALMKHFHYDGNDLKTLQNAEAKAEELDAQKTNQ